MIKLLFVFGTRPEAIKMVPLIKECQLQSAVFDVKICITGQHREMLDQIMTFFSLKADFDLEIMKQGQTLFDITTIILEKLNTLLDDLSPDWVVVQGDTTTAFAGALSAFYKKTKVMHLEAGLRTYDKYSPFPEEMNRQMISRIADLHLVPTDASRDNLSKENIQNNIHVVGNTVIDALLMGIEIIKSKPGMISEELKRSIPKDKRLVLVTGHRRESFGPQFDEICHAINHIAQVNDDIVIVYPVHLNPNVREPVQRILGDSKNVVLLEPVSYPEMIWLMQQCHFVLTDSGGVQEEAPALGKPVLVMRDLTERQEGIDAGTAKLVGTNRQKIIQTAQNLLDNKEEYERMAHAISPYGDGTSAVKIVQIIRGIGE